MAHRYWRIDVSATNGDAYARVGELAFRVSSGSANLCTGGAPIKTAEFAASGDNSALAAFDGLPATAWAATSPAGIGYDLVTAADVGHVTITARNDSYGPGGAPKDFTVRYSDDNVTFTTMWSVTNQTAWAQGEVRTFTYLIPVGVTGGGGRVAIAVDIIVTGALGVTGSGGSVSGIASSPVVGPLKVTGAGAGVTATADVFRDGAYPLGKRELTSDFLGRRTSNVSTTKRPDAITFDYLTTFSLGPIDIGDLTQGVINRPWYVRADNASKTIYIARSNDTNTAWLPETILFTWVGDAISEIDLSFEQAGRPVVCAERTVLGNKEVWLYWYKPFASAFVFEKFDNGRTPRIVLDNPPDITNSDVEFFYLKPTVGLVYRTQRDAYAVVRTTPHVDEVDWYLEDVFYTNNWRVSLLLVKHNPGGQYVKKRMETALMPVFFIPNTEGMAVGMSLTSLEDRVTLYLVAQDYDAISAGVSLTTIDDRITLIFHTLYDSDGMTEGLSISSIADTVTLFFHTLYDTDGIQSPMTLTSINDAVILFLHTLYDTDGIQNPISILSIDDS